ncbi:MAG TPA: hypothetical protein ENI23_15685 [bacterium]|nr:hypothetical protein [bacterium]
MMEVNFSEDIKGLKNFTQIDKNTWFVQRNKDSICESFYVTILANAIVMYGDYDGVIVKPHECKREALINWMANATTLGYFCEKVSNGNYHHKYKEFSSKIARESALQLISDKFDLSEKVVKIIKDADKEGLNFGTIRDWLLEQLSLEMGCHQDNVVSDFKEGFDEFEESVNSFLNSSFEQERDYFDFCEEHNFPDWYEYPYEDYTSRIRFQHQCLLWWARYVLSQREVQKNEL